jgi:chromosome partitioning protein
MVPDRTEGGRMAGTILAVAQQKGGAGKTTLAAHLAVAAAAAGGRVAVIDMDPQASLSAWMAERTARLGDPGLTLLSIAGWRIAAEAERAARDHAWVIIDCPPHAATEAKVAVRAARLVLVPAQPSPMDLWATRPTLDLVAGEGGRALIVLNRVPPRTRIATAVEAKLAELGVPVARTAIGNRSGFAAAMMDGLTITEAAPGSRGAEEIAALWAEIAATP